MSFFPSSDGDYPVDERLTDRLLRKCKEQPLVPAGMLATCGALLFAAKAIRTGDSRLANRMFYWRVGLQGFTLVALVGTGIMYQRQKQDQEELKRQKAKEREKLWLEELDRIEQENKDRQKRALSIQEQFLKRREDAKKEEESKRS